MNLRRLRDAILQHEGLNFALTNRIPRGALTRFMGWFSRIEQPVVRDLSIAVWKLFADLDLSDAKKRRFSSLHDCFTRELAPDARPVDADPGVLASPCDAIVGACGRTEGVRAYQAKGMAYELTELLGDPALAAAYRDGCYATLRLTSAMYHRFHAPQDCHVSHVRYFPGDVWNVNAAALRRIPSLFCRNERAVIRTQLTAGGHCVALVPVAAVLVASIRLHFIDVVLQMGYRGRTVFGCDASFAKGQELGWFEHGSTILVFAPAGFSLCEGIQTGVRIRQGQRLMRLLKEVPLLSGRR